MLDLHAHDEVIEIQAFSKGQSVLDLFYELDKPSAIQAIIGLQLAVPPAMTNTERWQVEAVLDLQAATIYRQDIELDGYAYRTLSGRLFSDDFELSPMQIKSSRSIYASSNSSTNDAELEQFQKWLSVVLENLINEASVGLPKRSVTDGA
ncbi:hypothetical protein KH389_12910 [Pseudomonas qingdaonensis]|uniref:Uncharacterized protein n=1 Tax=Pseudomonas qingdaonensis TaxID=2056231 RepID=A0ABX8DZ59_9PSED|nr:hypothetical protein [Pseudomonas qingdaonensis]QVL21422.1 hypothetical protein KH389_12910 [Pseudomonas qingdaonensis]